jgi:hypothetical protein
MVSKKEHLDINIKSRGMVVVYELHLGFQNAFSGNNYVERKRRQEVMFRMKICKLSNEK